MTISPRCSLANSGRPTGRSSNRDRAAHAFLDHDGGERHTVHQCVALDLALLHFEAFALIGLASGRYPRIPVDRHVSPLSACQLATAHAHTQLSLSSRTSKLTKRGRARASFSGGRLVRLGPPRLLSPFEAVSAFVERNLAARALPDRRCLTGAPF